MRDPEAWEGASRDPWDTLEIHCNRYNMILRHLTRGEIYIKLIWKDEHGYILYLLLLPHGFTDSPEGCWTQNVSENWELIVTINPFQVWSVWLSQPIRDQYCVCVTNQRPVSRSGNNWVCNCVSLRYKCHISDISDIRNGVPAINADLHRNQLQTKESWFISSFEMSRYFSLINKHKKKFYLKKFKLSTNVQ